MKKLASLLLLVSVLAISHATKAQEIKYRTFTPNVLMSTFVTNIGTVTTEGNWSSALTDAPTCTEGNYLCSGKLEVTSGSLPTFANILSGINSFFTAPGAPTPTCGVEYDIPVGAATVKVTFSCRAAN